MKGSGLREFTVGCAVRDGRTLVVGSAVYGSRQDRRNLYGDVIGVDMLAGEGVDVVHDLESPLPAEFGKFDHVDCCSVLEYVRRPWLFAANVEAAMVEGGTILVSVPWVWRVHAYPDDYWRMTPAAIEALFPGIEWERRAYLVEERLVRIVPKLTNEDGRWFARSELLMFGRKCASKS